MTKVTKCPHPFNKLTFTYSGHERNIEKIGCSKCNMWLYDKSLKTFGDKGN